MRSDANGWLWLLVDVIGVLVLAAAIAYGSIMYRRRRSKISDKERNEATRRLYESVDRR